MPPFSTPAFTTSFPLPQTRSITTPLSKIPRLPTVKQPTRTSRPRNRAVKMVLTSSTEVPIGTMIPDFRLPEPRTGKTVTPTESRLENGLLVVFICNHCPFVQSLQTQLGKLGEDLPKMGIGMLGISSNDVVSHPEDNVEHMKRYAEGPFSSFKYLYDETQTVAKNFHAACTPDVFLYDHALRLYYRGQIDSSRPQNGKPTDGSSLREAIKFMLQGKPYPKDRVVPCIGCNIKWKKGNEPDYFL